MALTKEDLQAIQALLEAERGHTSRMMDERFAAEREHTSRMIDERLAAVKADTAKIDKLIPKINGLYESVVGTGEKFARLDLVETRVDRLEDELFTIKAKLAE